ncbi:MAG: prephenate dehydratase [Syntrophales bacterium]|nr:prephenate dehydratase [Syntrophales bacterium]
MTLTLLERLREDLKKLDVEIVALLNRRAGISTQIGRIKEEQGMDVYDPAQEARVYENLKKANEGSMPAASLDAIFREIVSASRSLQKPLTVAYLGPEASFSHLAAQSYFGTSTHFSPQATIFQVFDEVERGRVQWGVVPVENSLEGSVNLTLDRLILTPLKIRAEIFLRISYCLLSITDRLGSIASVYSHPQALAQCQGWLRANIPHCALIGVESTAAAAQRITKDSAGAAIASRLAAVRYGLQILSEGIEDNPANTTRFLVIGEGESRMTGMDKTTILFGTPHTPGALYHAMEPFASRHLNMLKIESHPTKEKNWEYLFFVDVAGHEEDEKVRECLEDLKKRTTFLNILGSYPWGEGVS